MRNTRSFFLVLIFFLFVPTQLFAATFVFDGPANISNNSTFKVDVYVDTENSEINALGGIVSYLGDKLILEDVRDGGSLVSLWLDEPTLEKSLNNRLEFNGLIPGGYNGQKAYLFSLVFKVNGAIANNSAEINLSDWQVLLNDGQGTKISAAPVSYRVAINSAEVAKDSQGNIISGVAYKEVIDKFPPEKFTPLIYNNPAEADNTYIAFSSSDKESGIGHYEIAKSSKLTTNYQRLSWTEVLSPHKLKAQELSQYIYIKAVDRQGNFQVAVLNPTLENTSFWSLKLILEIAAILIGLMFIYIILRYLRKR